MTKTPRKIWGYTYALVPPQTATRLKGIKALLKRECAAAGQRAGTWEARLVADDRVSHILVVSDSPDLSSESNRRIESALRRIAVDFAVTSPVAIEDEAPAVVTPKD